MTMEETRSKEARRVLLAGAWRRQSAVNRWPMEIGTPIGLDDRFGFADDRFAALASLPMIG
jgi:hypothetical protein